MNRIYKTDYCISINVADRKKENKETASVTGDELFRTGKIDGADSSNKLIS